MSIHEHRQLIRRMLDDTSLVDAPTAYYALYHDSARTTLNTYCSASGRPRGFVGRFQTGHDLFRPLVTMQCATAEIAADLLAETLAPERPYLLFCNINQLPMTGGSFQIDNQRIFHIYYLDSKRFRSEVNVLVMENRAPDGQPRFEISAKEGHTVSGLNWQSPGFAEIYVFSDPAVRRRGYGRSVVSACTEHVLRNGRLPLYLVEANNSESIQLAETLGYVDSGARQVYADVVYLGHPARRSVAVDSSGDSASIDSAPLGNVPPGKTEDTASSVKNS